MSNPFICLISSLSPYCLYLTDFFISSSPPLAPLAPICVAMAAMLKRTQAFSYRRLVVIVKGTLLLSQELVSKQESHLKYIFRL